MKLVDSICAPGSALGGGLKKGAGDDRFAFDEAAGWAAVIDGATDVGLIRLFPKAESDAAHYAEIFAATLVAYPPGVSETPQAYFDRIVKVVRDAAARDARVRLEEAPPASLPTAAAVWVRIRGGQIESASLGDALAIVRNRDGAIRIMGDAGKPAEEQARARTVMALAHAERRRWLEESRARHNRAGGYWIFGVQPEAAAHIRYQSIPAEPGARILLMSDGFYRLVSPYGVYDDAKLVETAGRDGVGKLFEELRRMEANPADDASIGRFKTSDDATALLLEV